MEFQDRSPTAMTSRTSEDEHSENGRARGIADSVDYDGSMSESSLSDLPMSSNMESPRQKDVTWSSLPKKGQLAVIVLARLAEPLTERSLTSYLFYQLRWFDQSLDESIIAYRAGLLTAVFAAAQCVTAMLWGHAADNPRFGRKGIIMLGLIGSSMSSIGMGLTRSFAGAVGFRIMAGLLNGNIGVLRTMVSEIIDDKRYQSRAFLLLPLCFNVGVIVGPLLGGILADPASSHPAAFGPDSSWGKTAVGRWLVDYPYALPNIFCAVVLGCAALAVFLGLQETHPLRRHKPDIGRTIGNSIARVIARVSFWRARGSGYQSLRNDEELRVLRSSADNSTEVSPEPEVEPEVEKKLGLRDLRTAKVGLTMAQHFFQALHVSAFNSLLFILLPMTRSSNAGAWLPLFFTGGAGLSIRDIGYANTIIGLVGIPCQLLLYPRLSARFGVLPSYRAALPLSIIAYAALPYVVFLSDTPARLWPYLIFTLMSQVLARLFATPGTVILINESAPHPTLLGTVHGLGQSMASAARMIGPTAGGFILSWGTQHNCVGLPFWTAAGLAVLNWALLGQLKYVI